MTDFFTGILQYWVDLGLYDVFLPFIFMYTIVYAVLQKTNILGEYKNINSLVSFCIGFIATASIQTVTTVQMFFSATGFFVVAGLCVMILIGMFGLKSINTGDKWYNKLPRNVVMIIIAIGFFYLAAVGFGFDKAIIGLIPAFPNVVTQTILVGAVFVIIIWSIIGGSKGSGTPSKKEESKSSEVPKVPSDELEKNLVNESKFEPGKPLEWRQGRK